MNRCPEKCNTGNLGGWQLLNWIGPERRGYWNVGFLANSAVELLDFSVFHWEKYGPCIEYPSCSRRNELGRALLVGQRLKSDEALLLIG